MTALPLRPPAAGPSEAEAWTALLGHAETLNKVRHPKDLKDEMATFLSQRWDLSETKLDFADFGILWIDVHYRDLTTKMAMTGPGRESFSIAAYRILKTSRLEGYWDTTLENIADWIEHFARANKSVVTIMDFERILGTMPASRDPAVYKKNLGGLFWGQGGAHPDHNRTPGFLVNFPMPAYTDAYDILQKSPPGKGWEIRELMYQIQHRGILCKGVMLHIGFWFDPLLEEPGNRSNNKHPMFYHLKSSFSHYDPSHPLYGGDEAWRTPAQAIQRVVLNYTLEQWPKGSQVIGKLGTIQDMSETEYEEYLSTPFWDGLIHEIRKNTAVPFRHIVLQKFNNGAPPVRQPHVPGPPTSWTAVPRSGIVDQVQNIIRDEYSDHTPVLSVEGDSADEGVGNRGGRTNLRRESGSGQSDKELDYIVVGENASTTSSRSKKRKASGMKQEYEEDNSFSAQNKRRTPSSGIFERSQSQNSMRKSAGSHKNLQPVQMPTQMPVQMLDDQIPMNTIISSARAALASMQPPYSEPRISTKAEAHAPPIHPGEHLSFDGPEAESTPSRRLRKHSLPTTANHLPPLPPTPQFHIQPPYQPLYDPVPPSQLPSDAMPLTPQATGSPAPQSNSKIEQAIVLLQEQYGDKLQIKEMLAAIKLLKNEVDATIFLTLKPGRLRNAWLQNEIKGC